MRSAEADELELDGADDAYEDVDADDAEEAEEEAETEEVPNANAFGTLDEDDEGENRDNDDMDDEDKEDDDDEDGTDCMANASSAIAAPSTSHRIAASLSAVSGRSVFKPPPLCGWLLTVGAELCNAGARGTGCCDAACSCNGVC